MTDGKKGKKKNVGWTDVQGEGQQLATVIDTLEMEEVEDPKDLARVMSHREQKAVKSIYKGKPGQNTNVSFRDSNS